MKLTLYIFCLIVLCTFTCCDAGDLQGFSEFKYTDSIPQPTAGHCSATSDKCKVYAIGGYGYFLELLPVASNLIRIYDPETEKWSVSRARLRTPRMYASAGITKDGEIIIAGGIGQSNNALATVELYYPELENSVKETVICKVIGNMSCERRNPVVNVLDDGRILISGNNKQPDIVEKNSDGEFEIRPTAGKLRFDRSEHVTVKLNDGRVCFISGRRRSIEIFDPATEQFTLRSAKFDSFFDDQAAALLYNGNVLIVGGQNMVADKCSRQTWIYNVKADLLIEGPNLIPTAGDNICIGISDLQIVDLGCDMPGRYFLLCGGEDDFGNTKDKVLDSAWVYFAEKNEFIEVGPMTEAHDDFKVSVLPKKDGCYRALIIAGHSTDDKITGHCELFQCKSSSN